MRELRASVRAGKPIVTVRETQANKGAMSDEEVAAALDGNLELLAALDLANAIDWFRSSHFQKTSLLQVIRRLVAPDLAADLHIPGGPVVELQSAPLPTLPAGCTFHLYVSTHNVGAAEAVRELSTVVAQAADAGRSSTRRSWRRSRNTATTPVSLRVTEDPAELEAGRAAVMLLLLDANTWRAAEADGAAALARKRGLEREVTAAMRKGIKVLMAHECDRKTKPEACVEFRVFFDCDQTPPNLKSWGLYREIAVALHSGEHRATSLALLGLKVARAVGAQREPRPDLGSGRLLRASAEAPQPCALPQPGSCAALPSSPVLRSLVAGGEASGAGASGEVAPAAGAGSSTDEVQAATGAATQTVRRRSIETAHAPSLARLARGQKLMSSIRNLGGSSATLAVPREQSKREERAKRKKSLTAADSEEDKVGTKEAPGREISESAQARRSRLEKSRASEKDRASEGAGSSSEADEQSALESMLRLGVPREAAEAALAQLLAQRATPGTPPAAQSQPSATVLDC